MCISQDVIGQVVAVLFFGSMLVGAVWEWVNKQRPTILGQIYCPFCHKVAEHLVWSKNTPGWSKSDVGMCTCQECSSLHHIWRITGSKYVAKD